MPQLVGAGRPFENILVVQDMGMETKAKQNQAKANQAMPSHTLVTQGVDKFQAGVSTTLGGTVISFCFEKYTKMLFCLCTSFWSHMPLT